MTPRGTDGYAGQAETLAVQYETVTFRAVHPDLRLPPAPAWVLDIGSGTGRDAAYLAQHGYDVTAVEPVAEIRAVARRFHTGPIYCLADELPLLRRIIGHFDLILATAVWMHHDLQERRLAMARVGELLAAGGQVSISLRHSPRPDGRVM